MAAVGRYFDGASGARLDVEVTLDATARTLTLSHPDLPPDQRVWPLEHLRALQDGARRDQVTLALRTATTDEAALIDLPRLTVTDPDFIAHIRMFSDQLNKRDLSKGTATRIVTRAGLAVGAVALMLFVILPALAGTLAQLIPPEREARWGKSVVAQIERFLGGRERGGLSCSEPEGVAALDKMLSRLTSERALDYDIQLTVFDHKMVNAFAAPGGQVVIMRGLLDKASGPDEVAGVLAHEIGHVEARDVTRNTLRAAGSAGLISLVLGDFAGGTLAVVLAETTLSASYTRDAERAADAFALEMLGEAQVSSTGFADFFGVIREMEGVQIPEYLASHPNTEGRAERAEAFAKTQDDTSPVLTDREWRALQEICG